MPAIEQLVLFIGGVRVGMHLAVTVLSHCAMKIGVSVSRSYLLCWELRARRSFEEW